MSFKFDRSVAQRLSTFPFGYYMQQLEPKAKGKDLRKFANWPLIEVIFMVATGANFAVTPLDADSV